MPLPMPMPAKPPGGLPGPMTAPSGNAGAISQPGGNAGNVQKAMSMISSGLKQIQEALPILPMGSEFHSKVLKSVTMLAEAMAKEGEAPTTPKLDISSIMQMIKQHQQSAPGNAAAKLLPAQGATQAPATGAPPIPAAS